MANRISAVLGAALVVAALPLSAWAAGTATIQTDGKDSTLMWLNDKTLRIDLPKREHGYLLARDGKVYMVRTQAKGNMPPVMEVGSMIQGMAKAFGQGKGMGKTSIIIDEHIDTIEKTGKSDTVAGIKGNVYDVTTTDKDGKTRKEQVVFTNDPRVVEMTDVYLNLAESMFDPEQIGSVKKALPKDEHGILRVNNDMVLTSISDDKPAADLFELPSKPVNMGDMMRQMMEKMQKAQ